MIVSHKFKFIFIKTRKTAGTSIEVFLSDVCGPHDVLTPIEPHVEPHNARNFRGVWNLPRELLNYPHRGIRKEVRDWIRFKKFYNHAPASTARCRLPTYIWDDYFKFCVERNPWDKTLSYYHHIKKLSGVDLDLDDYLTNGPHCVDHKTYCAPTGELMVDRVLRYENLETELSDLFNSLNVPFKGSLSTKAKSSYREDRRPYREVLKSHQRDLIASLFKRELELFNFEY